MQSHKLIFIGGLHRSGKSLVSNCLKEHPSISGFKENAVYEDEGQHVQSVYKPAKFYGGPGRFGFSPEAHLTEESPLVSEENRAKLFVGWYRYWNLEKPCLLEQSPPNLIRTRFLQALFPDSYFIIVLRHPIPVSYETQKYMGDSRATIYSLMKHWLVAHETFASDRKHIRKLLVLKYEDFIKDQYMYLERIYSFLGLPNHITTQEILSDHNAEAFVKWNKQRRDVFLRYYIKLISKKFEARINQVGYSLYEAE